MRGDILARLRSVAGHAQPRGLGFVAGPVAHAPQAAPQPPAAPTPPPPRAVTDAADAIPDPEIRARFVAAAARYLARFARDQKGAGPGSGSTTG